MNSREQLKIIKNEHFLFQKKLKRKTIKPCSIKFFLDASVAVIPKDASRILIRDFHLFYRSWIFFRDGKIDSNCF